MTKTAKKTAETLTQLQHTAYEAFKLHWMITHGYTIADLLDKYSRFWGEVESDEEGMIDFWNYLEETGCYYNYTSDFGLGGFYAKEGFIHDDGAVIYSAFSALFLRSDPGNYTITAHLPLLAAE